MAYVHREFPEFSWSTGRLKMLENCNRRYYYHYYASHNGWLWNANNLQKDSYLLKKLTNRYSLSGDIVHSTIRDFIESIIVKKNTVISNELIERYIQNAVMEFNMHVTMSKQHGSNWNTRIKSFKMMQEFYYNEDFDAKQEGYMIENITRCMNNFFISKTLDEMSKKDIEIIENDETELSSFNHTGIKVYAKLDLLYKIGDKYVIVDWKTGKEEEADYLQLLLYTKYVSLKYNVDVKDIICRVEYLKTNVSKEFTFNKEDIYQVNCLILGSVSSMIDLLEDAELNKAKSVENFSKCSDTEKCKNCNFRKLCNE